MCTFTIENKYIIVYYMNMIQNKTIKQEHSQADESTAREIKNAGKCQIG